MRIGIVCGLQSEARAFAAAIEQHKWPVVVSGANAARAYAGAQKLLADGVDGLISLGLSGALIEALATGEGICAQSCWHPHLGLLAGPAGVLAGVEQAAMDAGCRPGRVVGSDRLISTLDEKADLQLASNALAVDMETHEVARAAQEAGRPWLAIRAVADTSESSIPSATQEAVGPNGGVRVGRVMWGLARRPWELGAVLRLGSESARAHDELKRLAAAIAAAPGI